MPQVLMLKPCRLYMVSRVITIPRLKAFRVSQLFDICNVEPQIEGICNPFYLNGDYKSLESIPRKYETALYIGIMFENFLPFFLFLQGFIALGLFFI